MPRSRRRAAALTPAASAPSSTSGTGTAGATSLSCSRRSTRLIAQGVTYLYFIDEIFLPQEPLLQALGERAISFGVQTRIDLWKPELLQLLGRAGCVSIEAGVESLTVAGRAALDKRCRMDTPELTSRLIEARRHVPFVQANLIGGEDDDPDDIAAWREGLRRHEVWANDPVPLFPYPASPDYRKRWGEPDDDAWERAHEHYLRAYERFSDIQDARPSRLGAAGGRMPALSAPLRLLMTTDAVGGVWRYALDLCRTLSLEGVTPILVGLGPKPSPCPEGRGQVRRCPCPVDRRGPGLAGGR